MNKLLIICGPTATGKTDLGILIAKEFDGEIISADSRQVYRGMDIVTGKDLPAKSKLKNPSFAKASAGTHNSKLKVGYRLKENIPIWLIDIVKPDYQFNVGEYAQVAQKVMNNIWSRNKLPIVVGGTGLYIKSLSQLLPQIQIPPDNKLREKLIKLSREELANRLLRIDKPKWDKMNQSDRQNPRRLIRAIEITKYLQDHNISIYRYIDKQLDTLIFGLKAATHILYKRIDERVEERIKRGASEELKGLLKKYHWNSIAFSSTGYRELKDYIDGKYNLGETIKKWKYAEHAYARRQMTWFKKESNIEWFDISQKNFFSQIEKKVQTWYTSS